MRKYPLHGLLLAAAVAVLPTGQASAETLAGNWSGSGYVQPNSGQRENVKCRVTFRQQTEKVFAVVARCASPSASIQQTGELLMITPTRYVGDFYNPQFDISGRVRVTMHGSSQTVTFRSANAHGSMVLRKR